MNTKQLLKRLSLRLSTFLLPISVGLIIIALTLAMLSSYRFPRFLIPVFALCCGAFLWYSGVLLENRLRFFFAALFLSLTGLLMLLIDLGAVSLPLRKVWPVLMLIVAFSFLASGYNEYRRPLATYVAPAAAFAVLGAVFLLFSINIIPGSIVTLAFVWLPLLALPSLIAILVWLYRIRRDCRQNDA